MINSLDIQNFQSHKASHLAFDEGVNVIIGESDSGKTAIIRALRWLVWNRPSGDDFRSYWGGDTEVEIELDENETIRRAKGKNNAYYLGKTLLEAFGTDVPMEITKTLNLNEINLQQQLDAPFLLSQSAGSVAEFFNRIAQLDKIDTGLQNVNKWIREIEQSTKHKRKDLEGLQEEVKQYDNIDRLEAEVEVLEGLEKERSRKKQSLEKLNTLINATVEVDELIEQEQEILKMEAILTKILANVEQKKEKAVTLASLKKLCGKIKENEQEREEAEELLPAGKLIDEILALMTLKNDKSTELRNLKRLSMNVSMLDKQILNAEDDYKQLHLEFEDNFPDICPLCNSEVKHEKTH